MNLRTVEAPLGVADAERAPRKLTPDRISGCWSTLWAACCRRSTMASTTG